MADSERWRSKRPAHWKRWNGKWSAIVNTLNTIQDGRPLFKVSWDLVINENQVLYWATGGNFDMKYDLTELKMAAVWWRFR